MTPCPHPRRRRLASLLALPLALALPVVGSPSADAALGGTIGDIDPATGFPSFYTDTDGLALQLCLDDSLEKCLSTQADLLGNGAAGEAFYAIATADVGGFTAEYALEAAYAGDGPGQEVVFARTRYTGDGVPGATYTFTGPYGTDTCTTDELGGLSGPACTFDEGGAEGGDVSSVVTSDRIGPFLTWDTFGGTGPAAPPEGYIGDPAIAHAVLGSPTGFNAVRVTGPGLTGSCPALAAQPAADGCAQTTDFLVAGRLANGPQGVATPDAVDVGSVSTAQVRDVTYTNVGTADLTVTSVAVDGDPGLSLLATDCLTASLPPGTSCTATVELAPGPGSRITGSLVFGDDSAAGVRIVPLAASAPVSSFATIADLDLGAVELGRATSRAVTVTNDGTAPLSLTGATLTPAATGVSLAGQGTRPCVAGTTVLAVGESCGLRITAAPTQVGERRTDLVLSAADQAASTRVPVLVLGRDTTAPVLLARTPAPSARRTPRGTSVALTFDSPVTGVAATILQLVDLRTGRPVKATRVASAAGRRWVLDPRRALRPRTRYQVRLLGSPALVRDLNGVAARSTSWSFRTR
ncbi:choice-of-anchor D domain-containing protein [Nocardioides litoris]|uniref:choice-of-anchor D domain-containing protein n=1 Tax=Nocardioides litoris TaxID=1926648 RepID=UPI001122DFA5|nr:choice-of-anchor D domain-containing protein [Nocardioides litoris]